MKLDMTPFGILDIMQVRVIDLVGEATIPTLRGSLSCSASASSDTAGFGPTAAAPRLASQIVSALHSHHS